jgi:hypothetical protein
MKLIPLLFAIAALSCCTTPADVSKPQSAQTDDNAKVEITDTPSGFALDVRYSRYQFVPETSALLTACKSILTARANEEATRRAREIQPVADQDIRVSAGRNIISARTSCRAYAEVKWKP